MSTVRDLRKDRNCLAVFLFDVYHVKFETAFLREIFSQALRLMRIIDPAVDPKPQIQPIGLVPEALKNVPQRQRVLAPRHRDQDLLFAREHLIFFNKALGLLRYPFQVVLLAQRQLMLAHVHRCFAAAFFTLHFRSTFFDTSMFEPPDMTAISLTTSPSFRISSSRIISPALVAMTDSGMTLIFSRAESSVMPGFTSYSLLRKISFTKLVPHNVILPSAGSGVLTAIPCCLYDRLMRIGMMVDTYKPYVSGVTNHVDLHKRALERAGHEVYVFTFGDEEYQDEEPRVFRSPGVALSDTGFYLSLRYKTSHKKLLQTMDVVHVHHPFLSGRLALNYCRSARVPIVFTNHSRYDLLAQAYLPIMSDEVTHSLLQAYMPDFCEAVDLVISPSESMAKILRELDVKGHIEVIPNGVDLHKFHDARPFPRPQFGFTEQDILLIYAGRIAPEKNINFLLQSFAGIAQIIPNLHLLIVGGGKKQFEDELQEYIAQLGIANRVRSTGLIAYDDIPSYLAMCDIFVT